jgi:hypothetical protein
MLGNPFAAPMDPMMLTSLDLSASMLGTDIDLPRLLEDDSLRERERFDRGGYVARDAVLEEIELGSYEGRNAWSGRWSRSGTTTPRYGD